MNCKMTPVLLPVNIRLLFFILTAVGQIISVKAETVPSAYQRIAMEYNVPSTILYGIAYAESGKTIKPGVYKPWPWTLNVAGVPRRYPTRRSAYKGLMSFLQKGIKSIDIGIMQVNWRYHHKKLGTPWQALDPFNNTRTGARILQNEYKIVGEWKKAIGRYHSPGQKPKQKKRAVRYSDRVMKHIARISGGKLKKTVLF